MARTLYRSLPKRVEFDFEALFSPGGKQGFLCISETTWELAYNMILTYGDWRSRYYYTDPVTGDKLTITDAEYEQIQAIHQLALEELQMAGCNDLTDAILTLVDKFDDITQAIRDIRLIDGCGGGCGEVLEEPPHDGTPPEIGPGEEYETLSEYEIARCNTANAIVDDIITQFTRYALEDWDTLALGTTGAVITIIAAWLATLVVAPALALVIGAVAAIATVLIGDPLLELSDVQTVLTLKKNDLVCALYNATDTDSARANFMAVLDGEALTDIEKYLVGLHILNNVLNVLFAPTPASKAYVGTVDCSACASVCGVQWLADANHIGGTGDLTPDNSLRTLNSVPHNDGYHIMFFGTQPLQYSAITGVPASLAQQAWDNCGEGANWFVEFVDITNSQPIDLWATIRVTGDPPSYVTGSDPVSPGVNPGVWYHTALVQMRSDASFSIDVRIGTPPAPPPLANNALDIDFDEGDFSEFDTSTTDTSNGHAISVDVEAEL